MRKVLPGNGGAGFKVANGSSRPAAVSCDLALHSVVEVCDLGLAAKGVLFHPTEVTDLGHRELSDYSMLSRSMSPSSRGGTSPIRRPDFFSFSFSLMVVSCIRLWVSSDPP